MPDSSRTTRTPASPPPRIDARPCRCAPSRLTSITCAAEAAGMPASSASAAARRISSAAARITARALASNSATSASMPATVGNSAEGNPIRRRSRAHACRRRTTPGGKSGVGEWVRIHEAASISNCGMSTAPSGNSAAPLSEYACLKRSYSAARTRTGSLTSGAGVLMAPNNSAS